MALIALDIAPQYLDVNYIAPTPVLTGLDMTNPKTKNSNEFHSRIMIKTTKVDFKKTDDKDPNRGGIPEKQEPSVV